MKEYRIVTHFTEGMALGEQPWSAFIFEPEFEGQAAIDYLAGNCGLLDDQGLIATGQTEHLAVSELFRKQERQNPGCDPDVISIFEKNSRFKETKEIPECQIQN